INLEASDGADRGAGDSGRFIIGKHDRVLGADAAARRAAALAVVLVLDHDPIERIHAVDAKQAKVDALHAIGAAAVVDDRIPAAIGRLEQLSWRKGQRCGFGRAAAFPDAAAQFHERRLRPRSLLFPGSAPLPAFLSDSTDFLNVWFVIVEVAKV